MKKSFLSIAVLLFFFVFFIPTFAQSYIDSPGSGCCEETVQIEPNDWEPHTGCASCPPCNSCQVCTPGEIRNRVCTCPTQYQYEVCNSQGTGWTIQTGVCPSGQNCENGYCVSRCEARYLDEWQCSGDWRERKYQNSDCSVVWQNYEYCSNGCSSGHCESCSDRYLDDYQCSGNWVQKKHQDSDCSYSWQNYEYCPYGCSGGSCLSSCHDYSCDHDYYCGHDYSCDHDYLYDYHGCDSCHGTECSISASVTTPGDTYVGRVISTTVNFRNTGDDGGYVDFNAYLCEDSGDCVSMICEDHNYRIYGSDPRVYVDGHSSSSMTCTATAREACDHYIKVEYHSDCDNVDPTIYSGDFKVWYRQVPMCTEKYLDNYECLGSTRRQQYQDSDCSVTWKSIEYCGNGCSAGSCIGTTTTTTSTGGSALVSVKQDYSVKKCEINSFEFSIMNVGPAKATFDISKSGSAANWIYVDSPVTVEKGEKKTVTGYASVPCDAKGEYDFTITASGTTTSSATSYMKVAEQAKPFTSWFALPGFVIADEWIFALIIIVLAVILLVLLMLRRRGCCRKSLFRKGCNAEHF